MSKRVSREERLTGVLEAFHSCRLDGLRPTRAAVRDGWDYIEGRKTLDEIIEEVVRRHTRIPGEREAMADENPWSRIIGPCYTVASMARTLGWTEAEVVEAGNTCRLLMLSTSDDVLVLPTFQLHNGEPVEGLTEILRILETGTRGRWTWAQWLNTELPDADPPRNIEYLYAGRIEEAIRDARRDAGAWSS